ncbi:MAG TPA: hypothetical protein VGC20_18550 [bacterium]
MERITLLDLQALWNESSTPCVSIFLPTHEKGPDTQVDPIALKNLARDAGRRLLAMELREVEARELLAPVEAMVTNQAFWKEQAPGLAVFRSPRLFRAFHLPHAPVERVVVTHRFHTRPLLPALANPVEAYVLAVSLNRVRLLRANAQALRELALPGAPRSLSDFQKYEDAQGDDQYRQAGEGGTYAAGGHQADYKDAQRRYVRAIAKAVAAVVNHGPAPLVFAGVEELFAMYREVATATHLLAQPIAGNPDRVPAETLREQALAALQPLRAAEVALAVAAYRERAGTGRSATGLAPVLRAAQAGQVDTLLLQREQERWGRCSPHDGSVETHEPPEPGDDELLDLAASLTLQAGGRILPMPPELQGEPGIEDGVAVLLRY